MDTLDASSNAQNVRLDILDASGNSQKNRLDQLDVSSNALREDIIIIDASINDIYSNSTALNSSTDDVRLDILDTSANLLESLKATKDSPEFTGDASFNGLMHANAGISLTGDILPTQAFTSNLGSMQKPFGDLYMSGNTIHMVSNAGSTTSISVVNGGIKTVSSSVSKRTFW